MKKDKKRGQEEATLKNQLLGAIIEILIGVFVVALALGLGIFLSHLNFLKNAPFELFLFLALLVAIPIFIVIAKVIDIFRKP